MTAADLLNRRHFGDMRAVLRNIVAAGVNSDPLFVHFSLRLGLGAGKSFIFIGEKNAAHTGITSVDGVVVLPTAVLLLRRVVNSATFVIERLIHRWLHHVEVAV